MFRFVSPLSLGHLHFLLLLFIFDVLTGEPEENPRGLELRWFEGMEGDFFVECCGLAFRKVVDDIFGEVFDHHNPWGYVGDVGLFDDFIRGLLYSLFIDSMVIIFYV